MADTTITTNLTLRGTIGASLDAPTSTVVTGNEISGQIVGGPRGETGPKGDPGTTDYNELQNLPDLTLKADKATTYTKTEVDTALTGKADTVHTHVASEITDFDSEVSSNSDVSANTAARHTHSNKATLDATTASFTTAQETKLAGIATGATANATDAQLMDRSTHTGTQAQSTITNLTTDLAAKANASATVNLTGNQTVADVKTFSSSPVVPTATTNTQAVNKAQMDAADALKVNKAGDTMTGTLITTDVRPSLNNSYTNGTSGNYWNELFTASIRLGGSSDPRILKGTGSPNGVVSGQVGSKYSDVSAANNAIEYVKAVGTGNTGWQIVPKSTTTANITVSATEPTNPVIGDLWVIG